MKGANERGVKPIVARLQALLASQGETALLRFSLGNACLEDDPAQAAEHLQRAVALDPDYSAAWKLLGKALAKGGDTAAAQRAYEQGIVVAERRGDIQAAKEMRVFLKRLTRE
jgi:predicted Zn-dependent protease